MFRSRVLPSLKPLAKPSFGGHIRGFCRRAADDGQPTTTPTPTTRWGGMPRPANFFTVQHQNPSIPRLGIRTISTKMAATKDYRLLCLENPLLGMCTFNVSRPEVLELQMIPRTTPLSHVVVPDRGLGEAPATQGLTMSTCCFTVLCPNPPLIPPAPRHPSRRRRCAPRQVRPQGQRRHPRRGEAPGHLRGPAQQLRRQADRRRRGPEHGPRRPVHARAQQRRLPRRCWRR